MSVDICLHLQLYRGEALQALSVYRTTISQGLAWQKGRKDYCILSWPLALAFISQDLCLLDHK